MDTLCGRTIGMHPGCIGSISLCHLNSGRDKMPKLSEIWSLHNMMREDPCRRVPSGITIEDTQLRSWLSNRGFLAVTEPINSFKEIDGGISLSSFCTDSPRQL
ncbi:uncharacterized protein HD556DRAFT_1392304 [Suillus plorans]|uniref:Uncharacterized protein n=1 Tax=Suillus plorans TaxID=116603 RepID=A0A9P7AIM7_9AGAM|nr:uncharacterized protein HD556DRAFT_1392304 [Suillus plorans]KAG1790269.1 hypothetical protein HD556DRAFT_1392304 [Suillus plorans]